MRSLLLGSLVALMLPAAAGAAGYTVIPPSNAGANQYVESVPTASGGRSTLGVIYDKSGVHSSASTSGGVVAPSTQAALVRQGRDGRRTARLARATAPARRRTRAAPIASGSSGPGSSGGSSSGGSSALGTLVGSLVGSGAQGGMGAALPLALLLTAVGLAVVAVRRRRTP